jgi:hypothetical protein
MKGLQDDQNCYQSYVFVMNNFLQGMKRGILIHIRAFHWHFGTQEEWRNQKEQGLGSCSSTED